MNRPFYSDYVRHMMRFYARTATAHPSFKTEVDRVNWHTCKEVLSLYPQNDREILVKIYGGYDNLANEVHEVSQVSSIRASIIWDMMKEFERKVAQKRGLI